MQHVPTAASLHNLHGLSLLRSNRIDEALSAFERAAADGAEHEPTVRYNIALMIQGKHDEAERWLDEHTVEVMPVAVELRVRALQALGRLEEALTLGTVICK